MAVIDVSADPWGSIPDGSASIQNKDEHVSFYVAEVFLLIFLNSQIRT